jgi:hypothetical protein
VLVVASPATGRSPGATFSPVSPEGAASGTGDGPSSSAHDLPIGSAGETLLGKRSPQPVAAQTLQRFAVVPRHRLRRMQRESRHRGAERLAPQPVIFATLRLQPRQPRDVPRAQRRVDAPRPRGSTACAGRMSRRPHPGQALAFPVKLSVDRDRRPGRFLLTCSAHLLQLRTVSESPAGRSHGWSWRLGILAYAGEECRKLDEGIVSVPLSRLLGAATP